MKFHRIALCVAAALWAVSAFARDKDDVIVMKNGDRLTGEIKGISSGALYASLDYVDGTVAIQWSKVARLESHQRFILKTQDGSVHSGTLSTLEKPLNPEIEIQVTDDTAHQVVVQRSQIVRLDQTSEKFLQRFNGAISAGTIYSKGNQSVQYSLGVQTEYLQEQWRAQAAVESTLSSSSGSNVSSRNQVNFGALRLLPWKQWFYSGRASFLESSEQEINLQSNVGAGIGRFFKNTNRTSVSLVGGLAWQNTDYMQSIVDVARQNAAAVLISANASVFKFKRTNLDITANLFPAISQPGRVFFATNASYYVKLFSNFSWNASFYGNWDTHPPAKLSGSDYGSSSGVTWTFGNR